MTAQIAIMNKRSIALATDSAVTIGNKKKFHNNMSKLFMLSDHEPIGLMIYNSSEFMGIPWEIVIKNFRKTLINKSYVELHGYGDAFIDYLCTHSLDYNNYEGCYFHYQVKTFLQEINTKIAQNIFQITSNDSDKLTHQQRKEIYAATLNEYNTIRTQINLDYLPKQHQKYIKDTYAHKISKMIHETLDVCFLSSDMLLNLEDLCILLFCKQNFDRKHSGIVIAGFGTDDIFPKLISYEIEGRLNGFVKYRKAEDIEITHKHNFSIIPFAQSDSIMTFLRGISPTYLNVLNNAFKKEILETLKREYASDLNNEVFDFLKLKWINVTHTLNQYSHAKYLDPILKAGPTLPAGELAAMAETLIRLTCCRSQVALDEDMFTVGEPINVAIISKYDGFKWIKQNSLNI